MLGSASHREVARAARAYILPSLCPSLPPFPFVASLSDTLYGGGAAAEVIDMAIQGFDMAIKTKFFDTTVGESGKTDMQVWSTVWCLQHRGVRARGHGYTGTQGEGALLLVAASR